MCLSQGSGWAGYTAISNAANAKTATSCCAVRHNLPRQAPTKGAAKRAAELQSVQSLARPILQPQAKCICCSLSHENRRTEMPTRIFEID